MNLRINQILNNLLANNRFWILSTGFILAIVTAGIFQLVVPAGSLQTIKIEQAYGFFSAVLLYIAILASPLTKLMPRLPYKASYLHARRAIGVLAFFFAGLHVYISFFLQLGGFNGLQYLDNTYMLSLLSGIIGLVILFALAATSLDWAVKKMHFKNWKLLHRLVYIASVAVLLHVMLIGPNYARLTPISLITATAVVFLIVLESIRIYRALHNRSSISARAHHS